MVKVPEKRIWFGKRDKGNRIIFPGIEITEPSNNRKSHEPPPSFY